MAGRLIPSLSGPGKDSVGPFFCWSTLLGSCQCLPSLYESHKSWRWIESLSQAAHEQETGGVSMNPEYLHLQGKLTPNLPGVVAAASSLMSQNSNSTWKPAKCTNKEEKIAISTWRPKGELDSEGKQALPCDLKALPLPPTTPQPSLLRVGSPPEQV